jgi:excisionase family DNA binding protein
MVNTDSDAIVAEYAQLYKPLIQVEEAAEIARVPRATIHAWSSAGWLDGFKVRRGRRVLFHRNAFVRFLLAGGKEARA